MIFDQMKSGASIWKHLILRNQMLEAERRTYRNPKVVIHTPVNVHLIARFKAHSEPASKELKTASRIEHSICVAKWDIVHLRLEVRVS